MTTMEKQDEQIVWGITGIFSFVVLVGAWFAIDALEKMIK